MVYLRNAILLPWLALIGSISVAYASSSPHVHHVHHGQKALVAQKEEAVIVIEAKNFRFIPEKITLRKGEPTKLILVNKDSTEHAFVVKTKNGEDLIHLHATANEQDTGVYSLKALGKYPIVCTVLGHPEAGMLGTLIVTP